MIAMFGKNEEKSFDEKPRKKEKPKPRFIIKNDEYHSRAIPSFPSQLDWKIGLAWANTRGSLNSPS